MGDAVAGFQPGRRVEPAGVGAGGGLLDDVPGADGGSGGCAERRGAVAVSGQEPPGPPPEGRDGLAGEVPDGLAQGPGTGAGEDVRGEGEQRGAGSCFERRGVAVGDLPVLGASFGGGAGLAAGRIGVRADQGGLPGGGQVAGGGPGGGDQAGEDAQVGEVLGGGGGLAAAGGDRRAVRVEQPQQVLLGSECLAERVGRLRRGNGLGAAEKVAAGAQPVAAGGAAGGVRVPAGAGVDRGMGGQGDEGRQPAAVGGPQVGGLPAGRAGVLQQALVARAGEDHREPPEPAPGPAELLLDGTVRVAGQALRAVAGGP